MSDDPRSAHADAPPSAPPIGPDGIARVAEFEAPTSERLHPASPARCEGRCRCAGERGVAWASAILREETERAPAPAGAARPAAVRRDDVAPGPAER